MPKDTTKKLKGPIVKKENHYQLSLAKHHQKYQGMIFKITPTLWPKGPAGQLLMLMILFAMLPEVGIPTIAKELPNELHESEPMESSLTQSEAILASTKVTSASSSIHWSIFQDKSPPVKEDILIKLSPEDFKIASDGLESYQQEYPNPLLPKVNFTSGSVSCANFNAFLRPSQGRGSHPNLFFPKDNLRLLLKDVRTIFEKSPLLMIEEYHIHPFCSPPFKSSLTMINAFIATVRQTFGETIVVAYEGAHFTQGSIGPALKLDNHLEFMLDDCAELSHQLITKNQVKLEGLVDEITRIRDIFYFINSANVEHIFMNLTVEEGCRKLYHEMKKLYLEFKNNQSVELTILDKYINGAHTDRYKLFRIIFDFSYVVATSSQRINKDYYNVYKKYFLDAIPSFLQGKSEFRRDLFMDHVLVKGRNHIWSNNLVEYLQSDKRPPGLLKLIIVLGSKHVPHLHHVLFNEKNISQLLSSQEQVRKKLLR